MGTLAMKVFESDSTLDWLWDLEPTNDIGLLTTALNPPRTEYLEAAEGELIIAAAEIVNGMRGTPREGLHEKAISYISKNKGLDVSSLIPKAIAGLKQIISEQSELNDLWKESPDYANWVEDVKQLLALLSK